MHRKPWTPFLWIIVALLTTHCGSTETTSDSSTSDALTETDASTDDEDTTSGTVSSDTIESVHDVQDAATMDDDTQGTGLDSEPTDGTSSVGDDEEMDAVIQGPKDGDPGTGDTYEDVSDPLTHEDIDAMGPAPEEDISTPDDISQGGDALDEEDPEVPCETAEACPEPSACQIAVCDTLGGVCTTEPVADGSECDDGNACNLEDVCKAGACSGQKTYPCTDENECTDDSCDPTVGCVHKKNLATCDDGDPCTSNDSCEGGICLGLVPTCEDLNPCTEDHCDGVTGECSNAANDELPCEDQSECTIGDACVAGECVPGSQDGCDDGNPCVSNTCSEGNCVNLLLHGEFCEDGDPCTSEDSCALGECAPGKPNTCDDENDCTDDSCTTEEGCSHTWSIGLPCEDGDLCTGNDSCDAEGTCLPGPDVDCDDQNPCTDETCDITLGCQVIHVDGSCDDGNACSENDSCVEGDCLGATVECDDNDACTQDSCDIVSGCQNIDVSTMCDDSNLCTSDICAADAGCVYTPNQLPCDDGLLCTTNDHCESSACTGEVDDCDDEDPCTFDACDHEMGCVNEAFTGPCDDGNACTTETECNDAGLCSAGTELEVDDNVACTFDGCDPDTGAFHVPNHSLCAGGQQCLPESGCVMGDNVLLLSKLSLLPEEGSTNTEGQWLAFMNRGIEAVDLMGYALQNAAGELAPLSLPASTSEGSMLIEPGQTRAAIKASDDSDATTEFSLVFGEVDDGFFFSADGDEISLLDEHGDVADSLTFSSVITGPEIANDSLPIEAGAVTEFNAANAAQSADSAANDSANLWCVWPQGSSTPEGPQLDCTAAVLNAITLANEDGQRWLEIHQPAGGQLEGLQVHFVDNQGLSLQSIAVAPGRMSMTRILTLKDGQEGLSLPQLTDGSVQLLRNGSLLDVYGFGVLEVETDSLHELPLFESSPGPAQTLSVIARRVPTGFDTDDNSVDWSEQSP
jgi:hypothetical protein